MRVRDLYGLSLHNLLLHKVRSLLTSLGIIFGVGSVIAMLAISGGAKKEALAQIAAMGIDNIIVYTKTLKKAGGSEQARSTTLEYGLSHLDLSNIRKMDNIGHMTTVRDARVRITKGIETLDVQMFWVTERFMTDLNCKIVRGRWLAPSDFLNASAVCVIGKDVKRKLFNLGEKEILGRKVLVPGGAFSIVGILENNAGTTIEGINSLNDSIYIPSTTGRQVFTEYTIETGPRMLKIHHVENDLLVVKVKDTSVIDHTAKRISSLLAKTHKDKDWGVNVPLSLLKQKETTQNIFTIVMGSIAAISLIVGGIGIMNIMLANVYERRKEIGTRRAMGAKKKDILFQFLIETVFLTVMGGILGIGLGFGLAAAVTHFSGMPSDVSMWSVVGSITISGIVGVIFGTYPAWQAANQNPIQALKAE
ncbi:MAG: ABC transporter permease [Kiritimatiellia bacterium]|jgi:putative ABC transport system permease protein